MQQKQTARSRKFSLIKFKLLRHTHRGCRGTFSCSFIAFRKETLTSLHAIIQSATRDEAWRATSEASWKSCTKSFSWENSLYLIRSAHTLKAYMRLENFEHANCELTRWVCSWTATPTRALSMLPWHVRLLFGRSIKTYIGGKWTANYWGTTEGPRHATDDASAPAHRLRQLSEWWIEVVIILYLLMRINHVEIA